MKKVYVKLAAVLSAIAIFSGHSFNSAAADYYDYDGKELSVGKPEYSSREDYWNNFKYMEPGKEHPADIWVGDFSYNINEYDKTATVVLFMGYENTVINVPETVTYEGVTYTVTKIGNFHDWGDIYPGEAAFPNFRNSFKGLVIPNTVKEIDNAAFYGMNIKGTIVIPDSVKTIGEEAFQDNNAVAEVVIGSGVKEIPDECFRNNSSLKKVTIGKSVKMIGERAFRDCDLKLVIIKSKRLKRIKKDAFNCYKENKKIILALVRR